MGNSYRTVVALIAVLWPASFPEAAASGYDTAHIVKRTCEPGGPLIVTRPWAERGQFVTVPGEVIGCPERSFQIAAGRERVGRTPMLCSYFSLRNGDGADLCSRERGGTLVKPLIMIRPDRSGWYSLVGIASADVATFTVSPAARTKDEPTVIPIERERAARLGARRGFRYFSVTIDRRSLCADQPLRVVGHDSRGRGVAESGIVTELPLLSATDRVPHIRSLDAGCGFLAAAWQTQLVAALRSLTRALI